MTYPILGSYFPSTYQKYVPQAFDNSLDLYEQMTALIAFLNGVWITSTAYPIPRKAT